MSTDQFPPVHVTITDSSFSGTDPWVTGFDGWLVSVLETRGGEVRYVVENRHGMLSIHTARELGLEEVEKQVSW